MALFGGEKKTKEEKEAEEIQKFIDKYGLDSLAPEDLQVAKKIATDLAGNGALKVAVFFGSKIEDQGKLSYLSALVEQNWLIINQLSRANQSLEKLLEK